MRERRIQVTRSAGRRRLRRLVIVVVVFGAAFGAGGIVLSPLLDVDRVTIRGAGPRSDEVRESIEVARGDALLLVDTDAAAERIEELPWVADADVARELPGTVAIRVRSRAPVAYVPRTDGTFAVVDPTGTVVAVESAVPVGLTALVTDVADLDPGEAITPRAAARVAAALGPLAGRIARVMVEDGQAALLVVDGPEIRLGSVDRLEEKARAADAVLTSLAGAPVTYVDVRVPSAPVTA